jgi:TPP-dependent pyruvate/acetoin dehydrogenase alpha subunit
MGGILFGKKNMKLTNIEKKIYYNLKFVRKVQLEMIERYHQGDKMKCPMHFCTGQEIMPAAISPYLNKNDSIYSHHRSHGYFLCKNGSLKKMVAEFYGKKSGTNGGLAGSQELSDSDISFYSGTILSGALAMGNGSAFASKYKSKKNLTVSVIGDGGMEEGIVYETINLAYLYKLPVLFICENNIYSTHTHILDRTNSYDLVEKIKPHGVKCLKLDTNNALQLSEKMEKVIKAVRAGQPHFVEIKTYRFGSHVGPEDDDHYNYRLFKEREIWKKNDPILKIKKILSTRKDFYEFDKKLEKNIMNKINEAYKFAENSKFPSSYKELNLSNSYSKKIKFYNNNIPLGGDQESHKPKPY